MRGSPLIVDTSKNLISNHELIVVSLIDVFTFKIDGIPLKNIKNNRIQNVMNIYYCG